MTLKQFLECIRQMGLDQEQFGESLVYLCVEDHEGRRCYGELNELTMRLSDSNTNPHIVLGGTE